MPVQRLLAIASLSLFATFTCLAYQQAVAQTVTPTKCGGTVQGEFAGKDELHEYSITLQPGDVLNIDGRSDGDSLFFAIAVFDRSGKQVAVSNEDKNGRASNSPKVKSTPLSARVYRVQTFNGIYPNAVVDRTRWQFNAYGEGAGVYNLTFTCLRDGGEVKDSEPAPVSSTPSSGQVVAPSTATQTTFVRGFDLPAVSFDEVQAVKLELNSPQSAVMSSKSNDVLGFAVDGKVGDVLELVFQRKDGNLPLGMAVLSPDNKVVFQASLVSSTTLNTRLSLPTAGQYTIGIYRMDLSTPNSPKSTTFQVTGRLNPK